MMILRSITQGNIINGFGQKFELMPSGNTRELEDAQFSVEQSEFDNKSLRTQAQPYNVSKNPVNETTQQPQTKNRIEIEK